MNPHTRAHGKEKLQTVSEIVRCGGTVRAPIWRLLGWFHRQRRGTNVVAAIRLVLKDCGLETRPDFANRDANVYRIVEFRPNGS